MMSQEKFTTKLQEALAATQTLAIQWQHSEMKPSHLLLALLQQEGGLAVSLLPQPDLASQISAHLARQPKLSGATGGQSLSSDFRELLANADKERTALQDSYVSVEHVLLALPKTRTDLDPILKSLHVTHASLLAALKKIRGRKKSPMPIRRENTRRWKNTAPISRPAPRPGKSTR